MKKIFSFFVLGVLLVGAGCLKITLNTGSDGATEATGQVALSGLAVVSGDVAMTGKTSGDIIADLTGDSINLSGLEQALIVSGNDQPVQDSNVFGWDDYVFGVFEKYWSDLDKKPYAANVAVDETIITLGSPKKISLSKPAIKLTGTTAATVKKVFVVAVHNGAVMDHYQLKKFTLGNTTWEYNIDAKYDNIRQGENFYFITAVTTDGGYIIADPVMIDQKELVVAQTKIDIVQGLLFADKFKDKTKCLLDVCMRSDKKITKEGSKLIQKWEQKPSYCYERGASCTEDDQSKLTITYIAGKSIEIVQSFMMGSENISVAKVGNFYVKKASNMGCGGGKSVNVIYNLDGTKATAGQVGATTLSVGGLTFAPSTSYELGGSTQIGRNIPAEQKKLSPKQITSRKDIALIEEHPEGNIYTLPPEVVLHVAGVPVLYKLTSSLVKSPGSRMSFMNQQGYYIVMHKSDYVMDGFVAKYYESLYRVLNKKGELVMGTESIPDPASYQSQGTKQVEVNKVKKLDDVFVKYSLGDHYALGLKPGYSVEMLAEMCKPVVYVYDKDKKENTLTVSLPQGGSFTHLDPVFTTGTSRTYRPTQSGGVLFAGKTFPYLYYSVAVPKYTFEQTGLIIKGEDVDRFFGYVLPRLCFAPHEQRDFIDYWKTEFRPGVSYFVSFKRDDQLNPRVGLTFAHKPQTQTRVLLEAYAVEQARADLFAPKRQTFADHLYPQQTCARSAASDVFERGGVLLDEGEMIVR